jgi:hypothetical protein
VCGDALPYAATKKGSLRVMNSKQQSNNNDNLNHHLLGTVVWVVRPASS